MGCIDKIDKKNVDYVKGELCIHCGYLIKIRNPSGYCDHLYYPENCNVCKLLEERNKTILDLKNMIINSLLFTIFLLTDSAKVI